MAKVQGRSALFALTTRTLTQLRLLDSDPVSLVPLTRAQLLICGSARVPNVPATSMVVESPAARAVLRMQVTTLPVALQAHPVPVAAS